MTRRPRSAHESYDRDPVRLGSNRSFGIVFFVVFAVIGYLWRDSNIAWVWYSAAAAVLLSAFAAPKLLGPFNKIWYRFGLALSLITAPIIMGILFYLVVTPTGLIVRALGKDPLKLRMDSAATSYWVERRPPGPDPKSMNQQF
jgi:hypothetical protein